MPLDSKNLNLGCGKSKIKNAVNLDMSNECDPDIVHDLKRHLPFENERFEEVYFFHCLEHVEKKFHGSLFGEIRRVLKDDGTLWVSYPEFGTILKAWLDGKDRNFYEATIYGRQLYEGDYHYSGIHTPDLIELLLQVGFEAAEVRQEPDQTHNTILKLVKAVPQITYEELLHREIFQ